MIKIKVTSEELIRPSQPTPSHLRKLRSCLFDHVNIPVFMPQILFYSQKSTPSNCAVLHKLRNSLSATLTVFYPLAGRVQDTNSIACNDEGVPYVEAQVLSTCLADVVHKADVSQLDKLLPTHGNDTGYTKLLLAVQVNSFACGGVAIGLKTSHAIFDAFSVAMFLKTWTAMASGKPCHSPRPFFDIWKVFPPHPSKNSTNADVAAEPDPGLISKKPMTKWFLFSKADCEALRSRLCKCDNESTTASLTLVLSAFIWNRIKIACRSSGRNKNIPHEAFHVVNIRPKAKTPPVEKPSYYFGNMVITAIVTPNEHNFVTVMKESVEKITGESDLFIKDLEEGREDLRFMMEHYEKESRGELASLGFTSLRSLPVYDSDFGWGKPLWFASATLMYTDLVVLVPAGPSSTYTFAFVNLTPTEMAKLEADKEFMSFVSKTAESSSSNSKL